MCKEFIETLLTCKGKQSREKNKYQNVCTIVEKHPILMYDILTHCEYHSSGNICTYKKEYQIKINTMTKKEQINETFRRR